MMMHVRLLCVGTCKERYWREACAEYLKRLNRYVKIEVREIAEGKGDHKEKIIASEGERILQAIPDHAYVIACAINGESLSSPQLAQKLQQLGNRGQSRLCLIIGGSDGLADVVLQRAQMKLSFSKLTFPHQLFRVMLLEQLYRACKINRGETYHK
jgi:23S rRNA (pseudouridine1915-N3)-methyltransferase